MKISGSIFVEVPRTTRRRSFYNFFLRHQDAVDDSLTSPSVHRKSNYFFEKKKQISNFKRIYHTNTKKYIFIFLSLTNYYHNTPLTKTHLQCIAHHSNCFHLIAHHNA